MKRILQAVGVLILLWGLTSAVLAGIQWNGSAGNGTYATKTTQVALDAG